MLPHFEYCNISVRYKLHEVISEAMGAGRMLDIAWADSVLDITWADKMLDGVVVSGEMGSGAPMFCRMQDEAWVCEEDMGSEPSNTVLQADQSVDSYSQWDKDKHDAVRMSVASNPIVLGMGNPLHDIFATVEADMLTEYNRESNDTTHTEDWEITTNAVGT